MNRGISKPLASLQDRCSKSLHLPSHMENFLIKRHPPVLHVFFSSACRILLDLWTFSPVRARALLENFSAPRARTVQYITARTMHVWYLVNWSTEPVKAPDMGSQTSQGPTNPSWCVVRSVRIHPRASSQHAVQFSRFRRRLYSEKQLFRLHRLHT